MVLHSSMGQEGNVKSQWGKHTAYLTECLSTTSPFCPLFHPSTLPFTTVCSSVSLIEPAVAERCVDYKSIKPAVAWQYDDCNLVLQLLDTVLTIELSGLAVAWHCDDCRSVVPCSRLAL